MFGAVKPLSLCLLTLVATFPLYAITRGAHGPAQDEKNELINGSRKAIINSGFSERYFDQHFKLIDAFNRPGDQRVVWLFSLGEYETRVTDSIGYNTVGGKRTYAHSIAGILGATKDIPKTISKPRARSLMTSCIGKYTSESIVLMKLESDRQAALYMMAYSARREHGEREQETREDKNSKRQPGTTADRPIPEDEVDSRPMRIGYVNLATGKCTRGQANVTP